METLSLFQELTEPRSALKDAIAADVEAAGGPKKAAKFLWPDSKKPLADEQRLRNAALRNQKQILDYFEIQRLKLAARTRSGASHIHALESNQLECKLHWATLEEQSQEAATCLVSAMQAVAQALTKAQPLIEKLQQVGASK